MKTINQQPKTTDYTDYTDENTKSCRDMDLRVPRPKSQVSRRKQFMRKYRKLYKSTKLFVEEVIQKYTNAPPPWRIRIRYLTIRKGTGGRSTFDSLVKYVLQKIKSESGGYGIISVSRQKYLDEIAEEIINKIKSEKNGNVNVQKWVKHPYPQLIFNNDFKIYFHLASFLGGVFRGIHVDTFAIMYEVESIKNDKIWNEFYRTMNPGCDGRVFYG